MWARSRALQLHDRRRNMRGEDEGLRGRDPARKGCRSLSGSPSLSGSQLRLTLCLVWWLVRGGRVRGREVLGRATGLSLGYLAAGQWPEGTHGLLSLGVVSRHGAPMPVLIKSFKFFSKLFSFFHKKYINTIIMHTYFKLVEIRKCFYQTSHWSVFTNVMRKVIGKRSKEKQQLKFRCAKKIIIKVSQTLYPPM